MSDLNYASADMNQHLEENVNKDRKVCFIKSRNLSTFLAFAMLISDYYVLNNQLLLEAQLFTGKIVFVAKGGYKCSVVPAQAALAARVLPACPMSLHYTRLFREVKLARETVLIWQIIQMMLTSSLVLL